MHKIYLYVENGTWVAEHTDPMIKELFDTDTLPTAYTDDMRAEGVVELVSNKFPQYEVWEK
tara:strand:- start:232 stop:414 length:183 start_codon:yes stop_codon:yes gene_type:complete